MTSSSVPRIAIIGAGPAGLTLARILSQNGISATIFERETADERSQGGNLDLHPSSGLRAIKEAGLFRGFLERCREEGEDFVLADKSGRTLFTKTRVGDERPEIERNTLRQLLIDSIPPSQIRWSCKLRSVKDGVLHFENFSEGNFDLIVGADGAWSKVRRVLSNVQPYYSGISGICFHFLNPDISHPAVSKMIGRGNYFAFSDYKGIQCQRMANNSISVWSMARRPEDWVLDPNIDLSKPEEAKKAVAAEHGDWGSELKDLILLSDEEKLVRRPFYMTPIGMKWGSQPGITVIGDAAHLLTPFGAEGVNIAMLDALELAHTIISHPNNIALAVQEYEHPMFERAEKTASMTWQNLESHFSEGGPDMFLKKVQQQFANHQANAKLEKEKMEKAKMLLRDTRVQQEVW